MPEDLKERALAFLSKQTPRVIMVIVTIGTIATMQWFGKASDATIYTIGAVGCIGLIMNWLIESAKRKKKK